MTGRFVWHELMTSDPKGAIAYYTEVVGWKTEEFKGGDPNKPYTMWASSQGPLGGVMELPEDVAKMGVPPHWMAHVEVSNVDETVAKAKAKGGKVLVPPTDIPTIGRFSVIADPQGASLSVFKPVESMAAHDSSKHGEVSWNELYADDAKTALAFYTELLGWAVLQEMDMGKAGTYYIFGQGDKQYGGAMTKTPDMPMPPMWMYYVHVDDLDAAIERASKHGGNKLFGPIEVPGGDRIAQFTDPQGAVFALHGK